MAQYRVPTEKEVVNWTEFLNHVQPRELKAVFEKYPPWELFWNNSPGIIPFSQRVYVVKYYVTSDKKPKVIINVTKEFNILMFERSVPDTDPECLTPAPLPALFEKVGIVDIPTQGPVSKNRDEMI